MTSSEANITLTDSAKKQLENVGGITRYSLLSGGCSGFIGKWGKDEILEPFDIIIWNSDNGLARLIIDDITLGYIEGSTIDFSGGPFSPAFKVIVPGASSCGCGESFVLGDN
jgi:Fe-S cluster assembly iron-binding protein IscA